MARLIEARADFVRRETALASPPLVPEIALYLAGEITPLWEASEATLQAGQVPPPYWAFAWPGGQAIARYVIDHPDVVARRRVLDFAAGSGIAAIAAATAGGLVEAADIDAFAVAAIELNAAANGVAIDCLSRDVVGEAGPWDIVLAGDVCYERPMAERVMAWLTALARNGRLVLLGDPGRAYRPVRDLEEVARYEVPTSLDLEDRLMRETIVWRVRGDS